MPATYFSAAFPSAVCYYRHENLVTSNPPKESLPMECVSSGPASHCSCTYTACDKRGNCCKCVIFHRDRDEIPGCFFTSAGERRYDRSKRNFVRDCGNGN